MFRSSKPSLYACTLLLLSSTPLCGMLHAQQSGAQTSAPVPVNPQGGDAASAKAGPVVLRGNVVDPDDEEIPGATVTLTPPKGKAYVVQSGSDGTYIMRGVPSGTYNLTVTLQGFAPFVRLGVKIAAETPQIINAKLPLVTTQSVVNVTTEGTTVSVDQDNNASATVLKGKDLDALSDDPDELSAELSALAGPSAGPNGGQIYIDGFTGGQLPPKSSIREIRINQNPFSAQYDRAGFGRVEVFTKPGTDKLHGFAQLNGLDKGFNTGSPFILPGTPQPPYHSIFGFGSLTGPINKNASYAIGGSYRNIQDNSIVDPPQVFSLPQSPGVICRPPFQAGCTIVPFNMAQFVPAIRWDIAPRLDVALGAKNTLTARFQYEHNSAQNGNIGNFDLFSTGTNTTSSEATVQISDTQIFSSRVINETRFEYQRDPSNVTPFATNSNIMVQGAFDDGGNPSQTTNDVTTHIEVQNYTSVALTHHFLRLGGRLRTTGDTNTTTAGANGEFTYNSFANYVAGQANSFTFTNIAQPTISARETDLGLYAEDDWKIRPNLTFSYGLRYETQNFIHDQADFAPRFSTAYGISKKTVLRAGVGWFYDRFALGNQLLVFRDNGINQQQYTLSSATGSVPASCNPGLPATSAAYLANCVAPAGATPARITERVISGSTPAGVPVPATGVLRSPYSIQANIGVDQQLFSGATMSVNYQHIRGVHQFNSDVPNPNATGTLVNPLLYQFQSNGLFNQNQLVTNVTYRGKKGSLFGYYVLNYANSDTAGATSFASIPNDLGADYGRASFDVRSRTFLGGSFNFPFLITASPLLVAASGTPYNITSGSSLFNDNIYNSRAVQVPFGTVANAAIPGQIVKTIRGCGTFATPGTAGINTPAPINECTGPATFTFNLRLAKTFGFGPSTVKDASQNQANRNGGTGGPPGTSTGGRPGGGGGGGSRGTGGGGFGGGSGSSSGKRYNVSIGAQAQNLFNVADRSVPNGVLTSPDFGISTQLAGGIDTTDSAVRRISLQLSFNF